MTTLPGILGEIATAAGEAAALKLARERGGTEVQISARKDSAFVRIVGQAAAEKIVKAFGNGKVLVPMATARGQRGRREAAARMLAAKKTQTEVALACDIHERTARRILERARKARSKNPAQRHLFDD